MQTPYAYPAFNVGQKVKSPLRGMVYCGLQRLRGRPIEKFIGQLRTNEMLARSEFEQIHADRLKATLEYARTHVPFYSTGAWKNLPASASNSIASWPVLEREVLQANHVHLVAQPTPGRIINQRSSGSSGKPVKVAFTPHAETWGWAHRYRGLQWHGIPIAADTLRIVDKSRRLRNLVMGQINVPNLDTAANIELAAKYLRDRRPTMIAGNASSLFYLARCMREQGYSVPFAKFARVGGEQLYPFQRTEIERCLAGRVVNSYGCTEIGALAGECPAGSMHVYSDHVHLEIFAGDEPAPDGAFGDIVVTSLHNPAMPLIRYKCGDRGRLSQDPCPCGLPYPVLLDLQARSGDLFRASDGSLHHGSDLVERLDNYFADPCADGVRQVDFWQIRPDGWRVVVELADARRASAMPDDVQRRVRDQLAPILHETLGSELSIQWQFSGPLAQTRGKHRYYHAGPPDVCKPGTYSEGE